MAKFVDLVKRLEKHRGVLVDGERFVAGCALGPLGLRAGTAAGGASGAPTAVSGSGATNAAESYRDAARRSVGLDPATESSFTFDGGRPIILGLTDRRVLAFAGSHFAKPKRLLGDWPRDRCELRAVRDDDGTVTAPPLFLRLPDGRWMIGEAPNVDYAAALVAAWAD